MTGQGDTRRRELAYLGLLIVFLAAYALPLVLQQSGKPTAAARLLYEDGLYEWVGALACLVGGLLFVSAWRAAAPGTRRNLWLLLLALFLFALFGEEVSWGKRLFGFDVPAWFAEHNYQGDLTLHNLDVLGERNNAASDLGVKLLQMYLLALPLLLAAFPTLGRAVRRLGVPVPALAVAFIAGVLKYLNREADQRFGLKARPEDGISIGEIFESSLELLLLAVAIECWLAARAARSGPEPASERVSGGPGGG